MMEWISSHDKKPEFDEEVIFYQDDEIHIGYMMGDEGSNKPRKWVWFSYNNHDTVEDVYFWMKLPEKPSDPITINEVVYSPYVHEIEIDGEKVKVEMCCTFPIRFMTPKGTLTFTPEFLK